MNIYTRVLKDKTAETTLTALKDIFNNDLKTFPEKFETDQGGEFNAKICQKYYRENNIYYHQKTGINKASFAEHAIFVVKRKLFVMLRDRVSEHWPKYLPVVTENLNLQPRPALGYMTPAQIQSPMDDPAVQRAKKLHHIPQQEEPSQEEQEQNQKDFEASNSPYKVGNYVFKNFLPNAFDKSFDTQVSIYILSSFLKALLLNIYIHITAAITRIRKKIVRKQLPFFSDVGENSEKDKKVTRETESSSKRQKVTAKGTFSTFPAFSKDKKVTRKALFLLSQLSQKTKKSLERHFLVKAT